MNRLPTLLLLAGVSFAADLDDKNNKSPRARRLRAQAAEQWELAKPVYELAKRQKEVTPEQARTALAQIEEAVRDWERSLQVEWETRSNSELVKAVKAYFTIRETLPEEAAPEDPEAREKWEKTRKKEARLRVSAARKFFMSFAGGRRYHKLFGRCGQCGGRKVVGPVGAPTYTCPSCRGSGSQPDADRILDAYWFPYSPLYRQSGSRKAKLVRMTTRRDLPTRDLAPFIRTARITNVEDHGHYVKIEALEKIYNDPNAKDVDKRESEYVLYDVGKVWYLYDVSEDRELFTIAKPEDEEES